MKTMLSTGQTRVILAFIAGIVCYTPSLAETHKKSITEQTISKSETFDDWKVTCDGKTPCRAAQSVVTQKSKAQILIARVYKSKGGVLVLTLPSGIFLAPGISVQIDKGKIRRYPFETCNEGGCHSGLKLDKSFLSDLKKGKLVRVNFFDGGQKSVIVELSLRGFSKSYAALD